MKSYLSLIPISAKVRKRQNRMTVFCIIISVFLVTAIFSVADMMIRTESDFMISNHGNWHIAVKNISQNDADEISNRSNVVISMVLALVLLVSGAFIHQRLNEPKIYDNYVSVNEIGIPTQVEQLPNPQYIDGTPRVILEVLNDLLPSGQAMQLADAFDTDGMTDENIANSPYKWMGYSLLVTFLISILGIILFQKKDIR